MIDDRRRREIHRIEVEHPIRNPEQRDEKAIQNDDDLEETISIPLSGYGKSQTCFLRGDGPLTLSIRMESSNLQLMESLGCLCIDFSWL